MTGAAGIRLQLVSTCLTFGRPYALPHLDNRFAFSPDEFRRLFPEYVVSYLEAEGRRIAEKMKQPPPAPLLPFPQGAAMPVIVAVRMSLSFPVLFSLVPMHYPTYQGERGQYEPVHFADGGITSNLPVHFFDSPFPRWPTLAINLQYAQKPGVFGRRNVDADKVWMTTTSTDGLLDLFNRFLSSDKDLGKILGLGGAIFRSAQVWSDNSFLKLPGYRDRVAEVWLDPDEGGMNLNMAPETIAALARYGAAAGRRLTARFADAAPSEKLSWDAHRWTRYRAMMAAMTDFLRAWRRGISRPLPGDRPIWDMLASAGAPPIYPFTAADGVSAEDHRAAAEHATRHLQDLIAAFDTFPICDHPNSGAARPFCGGPRSSLTLQGRSSLTPIIGESD